MYPLRYLSQTRAVLLMLAFAGVSVALGRETTGPLSLWGAALGGVVLYTAVRVGASWGASSWAEGDLARRYTAAASKLRAQRIRAAALEEHESEAARAKIRLEAVYSRLADGRGIDVIDRLLAEIEAPRPALRLIRRG